MIVSARRTALALVSAALLAGGCLVTATPAAAGTGSGPWGGTDPNRAPAYCPAPAGTAHFRAPGRGKTVALTFDDGPGRSTPAILAILARYRVTATFFNLGANEHNDPAPVRAEARAGYAIGDHTWDHPSLTGLSPAGQARQIDRERREQHKLTGRYPCLLRPPYGDYDATTLALAHDRGLAVWYWSVDTEDWKADGSGDAYWVDRIVSRAVAGGSQRHPVILMHNQPGGNPATVAALPRIIHYYRKHGYTFVDLLGHQYAPPVVAAQPYGTGSTYLPAGQQLTPGQHLVSANGRNQLLMQHDGDLVLRHTGDGPRARYAIWRSDTHVRGSTARVQRNGKLVIYSPDGKRVWSSRTGGGAGVLSLADSGDLRLSDGPSLLWHTDTGRYAAGPSAPPQPFATAPTTLRAGGQLTPRQTLAAPNRLTELRMTGNGKLLLRRTGDGATTDWVLWHSGTAQPGAHLQLSADGDLQVVSASGVTLWSTGTHASGARLVVRQSGNLALMAGARTLWATHTGYFLPLPAPL